jgi:outer membrane protein
MKNLRLPLLTVLLLAAMTFSAAAQSKIATVDMKKIFEGYWKTKQATLALENRKTELQKEMKEMTDGLDKAQTDYKKLLDQSNEPAISADEREKRKQNAADKAKEINSTKLSIEQFQRQAQTQIGSQSQRMSANLVTEIQKAVADKAKAGGYTLVMNAAAAELITVVYSDPKVDITADVVAQLNAGAPIDVNSKSGVPLNVSTNL